MKGLTVIEVAIISILRYTSDTLCLFASNILCVKEAKLIFNFLFIN